jgi:hypothetical protein
MERFDFGLTGRHLHAMAKSRNLRTWRIGHTGAGEFAALVVGALFMAGVGAFDAISAAFPVRAVYWLATIVGGGIIGALIEPWLASAPGLASRPVARALVQMVVMTFPITLLVWMVSALMADMPFDLDHGLTLFPRVLMVDVVVVLMAWILRKASRPASVAEAPVAAHPPVNPLADRLEPKFARAALIAVETEDHYLRVHTTAGQSLIYLSLTEALYALAGVDGLRVHRSWWVARGAVDKVSWRGGRGEVLLANGVRAPVSRSYAADVRRASWG